MEEGLMLEWNMCRTARSMSATRVPKFSNGVLRGVLGADAVAPQQRDGFKLRDR